MMFSGGKENKISEKSLDLSKYIGKGVVRDNLEMSGNVYFLEFEISVGGFSGKKEEINNVRSSV